MDEPQPDYSQERMLAVDDNEIVRETVLNMVSALGFHVKAVSSGPEALDALEKDTYSFLLTDMRMPEMDGMELIRIARDLYPDLSIISMTGYSEGYRYVDVINAGASDFIKKPFDIEELEAKIRRILNERRLVQELSRLSATDSLTGLYNHRQFFSRLKDEVVRAQRQKGNLAVVLLDLDGFKTYNDTYGHLAGDNILRYVGGVLRKCIRESVDMGFRYGGDEFSLILIDADMEVAEGIVERIRGEFEAHGSVSASFGIARFEQGMSELDLVEAADRALYRMKEKRKTSSPPGS
jgi:diguanylate cyclase (GGDEF)-like protein